MEVVLSLGDTIAVTLADSSGQFEIKYSEESLSIWSELPDMSGRDNFIYFEPCLSMVSLLADYTEEHMEVCNGIESEGMLYYFEDYRDTETIVDPKLRYLAGQFVYLARQIKEYIKFDEYLD